MILQPQMTLDSKALGPFGPLDPDTFCSKLTGSGVNADPDPTALIYLKVYFMTLPLNVGHIIKLKNEENFQIFKKSLHSALDPDHQ